MIRTVVCEKEGCSGNSFYIYTEEKNLILICSECGDRYSFDVSFCDYVLLSSCCKCNNDTFKIFKDTEKESIYARCTECGNPPDKIYVDEGGTQVSYEQKKTDEIKDLIYRLNEKIEMMENKIDILGADQQVVQQSLGYVAEFVQKNPW
ncbi:hypothetical protein [Clostridium polynesiense]|uniref:hypothetical protein n=1 Tax=Clostridium polynesiense TaxID=1325933 RepID=UPI00058EA44B|nr:hypothetical protein [Clostridium polynesiense]